jgi:hypothetical protein
MYATSIYLTKRLLVLSLVARVLGTLLSLQTAWITSLLSKKYFQANIYLRASA